MKQKVWVVIEDYLKAIFKNVGSKIECMLNLCVVQMV